VFGMCTLSFILLNENGSRRWLLFIVGWLLYFICSGHHVKTDYIFLPFDNCTILCVCMCLRTTNTQTFSRWYELS
jgi:hypothetical protein